MSTLRLDNLFTGEENAGCGGYGCEAIMEKQMDRNSPELIARIATKMKEKRYNIPSFAAALGMSRQWGYAVMKNRIKLSAEALAEIAKILDVSMDWLYDAASNNEGRIELRDLVTKICDERIEERMRKSDKSA